MSSSLATDLLFLLFPDVSPVFCCFLPLIGIDEYRLPFGYILNEERGRGDNNSGRLPTPAERTAPVVEGVQEGREQPSGIIHLAHPRTTHVHLHLLLMGLLLHTPHLAHQPRLLLLQLLPLSLWRSLFSHHTTKVLPG